jgi:hypothetical protein
MEVVAIEGSSKTIACLPGRPMYRCIVTIDAGRQSDVAQGATGLTHQSGGLGDERSSP